ncbi:MAG: hypothetical protein ACR2NU_06965 [Aeoliella sp.]
MKRNGWEGIHVDDGVIKARIDEIGSHAFEQMFDEFCGNMRLVIPSLQKAVESGDEQTVHNALEFIRRCAGVVGLSGLVDAFRHDGMTTDQVTAERIRVIRLAELFSRAAEHIDQTYIASGRN